MLDPKTAALRAKRLAKEAEQKKAAAYIADMRARVRTAQFNAAVAHLHAMVRTDAPVEDVLRVMERVGRTGR